MRSSRDWDLRTDRHRAPFPLAFLYACALLCFTAIAALCIGRYPITPLQVGDTLLARLHPHGRYAPDGVIRSIVLNDRLPRILGAALVGASLSVSGGAYQAVFRNPLASPSILGVLSGSALGGAVALVLQGEALTVRVAAFGGGLLAVGLGIGIAKLVRGGGVLTLVLGGMVCNALLTSLLSLVKYVADPVNQLPSIVYWMLGSLAQVGMRDIRFLVLPLVTGIGILCAVGRWLDALALSDDEARSLGVPVRLIRLTVIVIATFLAALTVSLAGVIAWVSLLVPHIARALVGPSNERLIPLSAVLGAVVLIIADTCARSVFPGEIPLGILTEMFGALAFGVVLRKLRIEAE